MQVVTSAWDVVSAFLIFIAGFLLAIPLSRWFEIRQRRVFFIYIWHTLFAMLNMAYSIKYGSDSIGYYDRSLLSGNVLAVGTEFVTSFTSVLTGYLKLSYLGAYLVFNVLGYVGLVAFYASLRQATLGKPIIWRRVAFLIILLPSFSFWSSAISKDAFSFMSCGLALWASLSIRRRSWVLILAIGLMFLVRPHIAALMVTAGAASLLFTSNISILQRLIIGSIALVGALAVVPFAMSYTGFEDGASSAEVVEFVERRQGYQDGGGGINISAMSPPMQLFTYLFRPFPFEAHNATAFAASLENMLLLALLLVGIFRVVRSAQLSLSGEKMFLWIYALSTWAVLAVSTANLGISVRQKWMFVPILIYLALSAVRPARRGG
ncbi:MAG: hypothetical protein EOP38_05125 [Rubrivivax sp.]|nr:MAG: hypothetical protein EOP38_05125 [Rubrivivax sp.]